MKVISVLGSPRKKGTSNRIAQSFTDTAERLGATVDTFYLNALTYKGCQACEQCHSTKTHCIVKDDVTAILDGMKEADIAVFTSPVYYGDVSGQFKMFFDRTWSLVDVDFSKPSPFAGRLSQGKTAIFILSQGDSDDTYHEVITRYTDALKLYGYSVKILRATSQNGSPDNDVSDIQSAAVTLAEQLIHTSSSADV
ncbi:flavodoxin family protein [Halodesulfovibrio spirochaetisodalis]|uniref:flavodoxin family protein n=1 Tax=Halodesulfovibrio spirochaetisodalis TaxID=1560234 RepID=UPI00082D9752|nr:flavodoxin family protein [Halodesulfovibrio spirochaetisodalis]